MRSLANLCDWAADRYAIRVLTRNRDLGEQQPYQGCGTGTWHSQDGITVGYVSESFRAPGLIRRAVREAAPDLLYFQSFLDPLTTVLPLTMRRLGLLPVSIPAVVAPRGELSPGALALKARKKNVYLRLARWFGLYRGVAWHATSDAEAGHIRRWAGADARVFLAPNLPRRAAIGAGAGRRDKRPGQLRLAFLSRVSRMKNLDGAIAMLAAAGVPVEFDIYGMLEDAPYWEHCQAAIRALPRQVTVRYCGVVPPADVPAVLDRYHAFFLPTLGENFGHVILEALLAGCPVLISDRTPWRGLEARRAGFDIDLENPDGFAAALRRLADMDAAQYTVWSDGARHAGLAYSAQADVAVPTFAMLAALTGD